MSPVLVGSPESGAETRLRLLAKVGELASLLQSEQVLPALARLPVPEMADWCILDVVEDEEMRRPEVAHRDPARATLADALRRLSPTARHRGPLAEALRSGRPLLVAEYTEEMARAEAPSLEHLALALELRARSVLVVPLVLRGQVVAVETLVMTAESDRRYGPEDLALAEELAQRSATLVENARLHRELEKSERRFRIALAHTHVTVFEKDRDLRFRWVYNPMLGAKAADLIGRKPEETSDLDARQRAVIETGKPSREEFRIHFRGETREVVAHMEPLRDPTGEIAGLTGAVVDVTEQKQVQEALAEALAFRERMMGILGHDLRNPLSAVRVLSSLLLRREDLGESARGQVAEIERAARRMTEMIGTLLDFSESRYKGTMPVAPVPMDLGEVARAAVGEIFVANPDREIELSSRGDLRGRWDQARMAQVVSNLVANAITHGAPDEPVRVSLHGEGDEVRLEVRNGGLPIPPELLPVLFEPFRRGSATGDSSHARGLGLGLYIAKQIVAAHGGEIGVRSTAERETVFEVRLPRGIRLAATPEQRDGAADSPGTRASM